MKRVLIAGIGNILLGDDGVGPYVVRTLGANYIFDDGVEIVDVGTPALDFIDLLDGLDLLIVVDAIRDGAEPGTVKVYEKAELLRHTPGVRMDPHSPALIESLLAAEFYGSGPREVALVGVQGARYEAGCSLSEVVQASVEQTVHEVLRVLDRADVGFVRRFDEADPAIWWSAAGEEVA